VTEGTITEIPESPPKGGDHLPPSNKATSALPRGADTRAGSRIAPAKRMGTTFEDKLRAAISAGWRVLLIEIALLLVAWLVYRATVPAGSGAMLVLIGPAVTSTTVASVWLMGLTVFKLALWLQAALLLWAWMWSVMLRKPRRGESPSRTEGTETVATPGPGTPVAGAPAR
jgi:hypothetical protein